mmetsp:Transcript_17322/g.52193  ORF Transcript_17322/g.52193 Transcript_17322/m.52193 type:complete len:205 (-) Transcript_17322:808-1422(-)
MHSWMHLHLPGDERQRWTWYASSPLCSGRGGRLLCTPPPAGLVPDDPLHAWRGGPRWALVLEALVPPGLQRRQATPSGPAGAADLGARIGRVLNRQLHQVQASEGVEAPPAPLPEVHPCGARRLVHGVPRGRKRNNLLLWLLLWLLLRLLLRVLLLLLLALLCPLPLLPPETPALPELLPLERMPLAPPLFLSRRQLSELLLCR